MLTHSTIRHRTKTETGVNMRHSSTALAAFALLCSAQMAHAANSTSGSIESAVERAELIVIGNRGKKSGSYDELHVTRVIFGSGAKAGETILVRSLHRYTSGSGAGKGAEPKGGPDLAGRPVLLCLSRKAIYDKNDPKNAYEFQTTGNAKAIKIIDGSTVYGYYQNKNPGRYKFLIERNSATELSKRIARAIVLSRKWRAIMPDRGKNTGISREDAVGRDDAIVKFLGDRTLPSHFCWKACSALQSRKLIPIIRDEVENVKAVKSSSTFPDDVYSVHGGWTRLSSALMFVRGSQKELLPLLKKTRTRRPQHYDLAVRCAVRTCRGADAVPFFKQAMLDSVAFGEASAALIRIGTDDARVAFETVLEKLVPETGYTYGEELYAKRWPKAWKPFASRLERTHPKNTKVKSFLKNAWKNVVRERVFEAKDVPKRYRQ